MTEFVDNNSITNFTYICLTLSIKDNTLNIYIK